MRLTCFLIVLLTFSVQASVYAQHERVNLEINSESLSNVLMKIKDQTGVRILYNENLLKNIRCENLTLKQLSVEDALSRIFESTNLGFEKSEGVIVVKERNIVAQQQNSIAIKGRVIDEKGLPLPGVTVMIKGTQLGSATDADGKFFFTVPAQRHVLLFTMIGMEQKELSIDARKDVPELEVVMKVAVNELEDVVVTGIFKKSRESFTGSVSTISEKELKTFRGRNLLSTLKNIDPTFNIVENNIYGSDPNHLPEVQIRGTSSLPTVEDLKNETKVDLNTPLIILDGFEISLSRMLDLNDEDISSITLLKDGSATAIYGSRGANGVVVIENKAS